MFLTFQRRMAPHWRRVQCAWGQVSQVPPQYVTHTLASLMLCHTMHNNSPTSRSYSLFHPDTVREQRDQSAQDDAQHRRILPDSSRVAHTSHPYYHGRKVHPSGRKVHPNGRIAWKIEHIGILEAVFYLKCEISNESIYTKIKNKLPT